METCALSEFFFGTVFYRIVFKITQRVKFHFLSNYFVSNLRELSSFFVRWKYSRQEYCHNKMIMIIIIIIILKVIITITIIIIIITIFHDNNLLKLSFCLITFIFVYYTKLKIKMNKNVIFITKVCKKSNYSKYK